MDLFYQFELIALKFLEFFSVDFSVDKVLLNASEGKFDLLHHFELHPLKMFPPLELFGIDLSITKAVIMLGVVGILMIVLLTLAASTAKIVPTGIQNLFEPLILFIKEDLIEDIIGKNCMSWFPFIATLFFFILFSNLVGLIPGTYTTTSNINVTATLALVVFFAVHITGVRKHGIIAYAKAALIAPDVPIVLAILMIPIEFIGHIAKPFSLAVRLFANMFAGHAILLVFLFLIVSSGNLIIGVMPLAGVIIMSMLEIGFSFIQAYIFVILSSMYISASLHLEH